MDAARFDRLVLTLTRASTRRSALGLLGALGLTRLLSEEVRATHTPGGCRHNGERCARGDQCCSGRCVRKPRTNTRFCRKAPGQGICTIETDGCLGTGGFPCNDPSFGSCRCVVTRRGYSLCAETTCFACETTAECVGRAGGQQGDQCIACEDCGATAGRACVRRCPNPATA
jgi:hypothetical protein